MGRKNNIDWVMCWEQKDATSSDGNENDQSAESRNQTHPKNSKWKNDVVV